MTVELRCPQCGRFLGEVEDFGRAICGICKSELVYRSREHRRRGVSVLTASYSGEVTASTSA